MNHVVVIEYITEKYAFLNNQSYTVETENLEWDIPETMFDMNKNLILKIQNGSQEIKPSERKIKI